jgi:hypothetical protein
MTTHSHRQLSRRGLLIVLVIIALCAWGGLLLFTRFVPPRSLPAIIVAFILLGVALDCTCTLLIYLVSRLVLAASSRRPGMFQVMRQGGLFTVWLLFNALLSVLHSWSPFTTVVSFGIIVVVELLVLGH